MAKFETKTYVVDAVQYTNQYNDEIKSFLGDIPHRFDNAKGIFVATLGGVVLVESYNWMIKCPDIDNGIYFSNDKDFKKFFVKLLEE